MTCTIDDYQVCASRVPESFRTLLRSLRCLRHTLYTRRSPVVPTSVRATSRRLTHTRKMLSMPVVVQYSSAAATASQALRSGCVYVLFATHLMPSKFSLSYRKPLKAVCEKSVSLFGFDEARARQRTTVRRRRRRALRRHAAWPVCFVVSGMAEGKRGSGEWHGARYCAIALCRDE